MIIVNIQIVTLHIYGGLSLRHKILLLQHNTDLSAIVLLCDSALKALRDEPMTRFFGRQSTKCSYFGPLIKMFWLPKRLVQREPHPRLL